MLEGYDTRREILTQIVDAFIDVYRMTAYPANDHTRVYSTCPTLLVDMPASQNVALVPRQRDEVRLTKTVDKSLDSVAVRMRNGTVLYVMLAGQRKMYANFIQETYGRTLVEEDLNKLGEIDNRLGGLIESLLIESKDVLGAHMVKNARRRIREGKPFACQTY